MQTPVRMASFIDKKVKFVYSVGNIDGEVSSLGKIGFVTLSHPDYIDGTVEMVTNCALEMLQNNKVEVYAIEKLICDSQSAEAAGKELIRADVDGVILFLGSWIECPVAMSVLREVDHLPLCLWGFPMIESERGLISTGSYVTYAMFQGVMNRLCYSYKGILGNMEESRESVLSFVTAATVYQRLKRSRIGLVGYTSMSIYTGTFDHVLMRGKIGPEIQQIDSYSLIKRAEAMKENEIDQTVERLKCTAKIAPDVTQGSLEKVSRLYLGLMSLKEQYHLDAINVKCQYEFSKEYGMVMCVPLSLAADSGIVASCEGDMLCTVSMLILHLITGQVITYGDSINHIGNTLKLSACGFAPFSLGDGKKEIRNFMPNRGFTGIQNSFVMKPDRVTVMRLVEDVGDYHLLYFTGAGKRTQLREGCMPALDIELDGNMKDLVRHYNGQHYAICYGDISSEIEDLARILKIKTIRI